MNTPALSELSTVLAREGVRSALRFLNGLTGHRFTALYWYAGDILQNLYFFDRENPSVEDTDDLPVEVTYCVYVRESGKPFCIEDALRDDRVTGHPSRSHVQAYCGVPLIDKLGRIVGTICHFDLVPTPIADENITLMEALAPLLIEHAREAKNARARFALNGLK